MWSTAAHFLLLLRAAAARSRERERVREKGSRVWRVRRRMFSTTHMNRRRLSKVSSCSSCGRSGTGRRRRRRTTKGTSRQLVSWIVWTIMARTSAVTNDPAPPAIDGNPEFGDVPRVPAGVPVFPNQEMLNLSPEQLVRASLPWQGMDTPWRQPGGPGAVGNAWRLSKFARMNFARRQPWDTDTDVDQNAPFDSSVQSPVPAHPPPFVLGGDGHEEVNKKLNDPTWERIVNLPLMLPNAPAQYGHGYKPAGYYRHPFKRLGTNNDAPLQSFLQIAATPRPARARSMLRGSSSRRPRRRRREERDDPVTREDTVMLDLTGNPDELVGVATSSLGKIVGAPATFDPSNPIGMTQPTVLPPSPFVGPVEGLYFDNYDIKMIRQQQGSAGREGDLTLPRMARPEFTGANEIFKHITDPPLPIGQQYGRTAMYPPKPPAPLFG